MTTYLNNPDAVRALVQPDRVHRDLYINQEIFQLEQTHFFVNTWNYAGHESQIPDAGDWISSDIGGRPLLVVRQADGSIKAMMNRCAQKGSRLVSAPSGNTDKHFRCPYHAWTFKTDGSLLAIPLRNAYKNTRLNVCESGRGLTGLTHLRTYRGFNFLKINDAGPDFETYFGDSLSSIDNTRHCSCGARQESELESCNCFTKNQYSAS